MNKGVGMVEVLVLSAFLGVSLLGVGILAAEGTKVMAFSADRHEATLYAREGIEAVKALRNESWDINIAPLAYDTTYYLVENNGAWELITTDPGALYGRPQNFSRTIVFDEVFRDANDNIAESGTQDLDTRNVIVEVTWTTRGTLRTVTVETYVTNISQN